MNKMMTVLMMAVLAVGVTYAKESTVDDIDYKIMVQRATQAAIWGMPAAGMINLKGTLSNSFVAGQRPAAMSASQGLQWEREVTA